MQDSFEAWLRGNPHLANSETNIADLCRMWAEAAFFAGWNERKRLTYETIMSQPVFGQTAYRKTLDNLLQ